MRHHRAQWRKYMAVALVLASGHADRVWAAPSGTSTEAKPATPQKEGEHAGEDFGEDQTFAPRAVISFEGQSSWDNAPETISAAFKKLNAAVAEQKLEATGPLSMLYTKTDDREFEYRAFIPVKSLPATPAPAGLKYETLPGGKAIRFVHKGSFDMLESLYEAITHRMDERRIDTQDQLLEEYATDPATTPEDQLTISVYVFPK